MNDSRETMGSARTRPVEGREVEGPTRQSTAERSGVECPSQFSMNARRSG